MVDPVEYLRIVLDERTLPTVVTPMILRKGEVAHLQMPRAVWRELRPSAGPGGVSFTTLETGRLFVTNQRIILSGGANDLSLEYRDIEGVIAHAAELTPERFRDAVRDRAADLRRNLKLTTLNLALPTVSADKPGSNAAELFKLLEGFEMKGSLNEARTRYGQPEFLF